MVSSTVIASSAELASSTLNPWARNSSLMAERVRTLSSTTRMVGGIRRGKVVTDAALIATPYATRSPDNGLSPWEFSTRGVMVCPL
jgi:hypothetical protein